MKKIIIIVIVLFLLAGGGFAAWKFLLPKSDTESKVKEVDPHTLVESQIHIESLTTNLLSPNNYAVISLSVQAADVEGKEELEARLPQIKTITISTLNSLKKDELMGSEGTKNLIDTLKKQYNGVMTHGEVTDVYITDYKLQ